MTRESGQALLEVTGLKTHFDTDEGVVKAVDGLSLSLTPGETLGIVGESGSGKTVTALSVLRLLPKAGRVVAGDVRLEGRDLFGMSAQEIREVRGNEISMVFQDPLTALNPVLTVGYQIAEAVRLHQRVDRATARAHAVELLARVGIPEPHLRVQDYPHQLSGGMRQRAMIAIALSCRPKILIADEPTTALDVTIQAQILALVEDLKRDYGTSIILITHDLGVIAEMAETVMVMYAGRKVEQAPVEALFSRPRHPYTWNLLKSLPRLDEKRAVLPAIPGIPPSLICLPAGCHFRPRCRFAKDVCGDRYPDLRVVGGSHVAACHFAECFEEEAVAAGDRGCEAGAR